MRNLILVAIGLAGGAAIVGVSHSIWHQPSEQNTTGLGGLQASEHSNRSVESVQDSSDVSGESPEQNVNTGMDQAAPRSSPAERSTDALKLSPSAISKQISIDSQGRVISDEYASMAKPRPLPERLTTQELYQSVEADSRDESWAYPMELGINQYIAKSGGKYGAAFEYVECRSRYCTIAGVVHGGGQETVNEFMAEMTQSGWWQTYGGRSTVGSRNDTEYRFVSIIPRAEEDTARGESAAQSAQK